MTGSEDADAVAECARQEAGEEAAEAARAVFEGENGGGDLGDNLAKNRREELAARWGIDYQDLLARSRYGDDEETDAEGDDLPIPKEPGPEGESLDETARRLEAHAREWNCPPEELGIVRRDVYDQLVHLHRAMEELDADADELGLIHEDDWEAFTSARDDLAERVVETTDLDAEDVDDLRFAVLSKLADGDQSSSTGGRPAPRSGDVSPRQHDVTPADDEEVERAQAMLELAEGHDGTLAEVMRRNAHEVLDGDSA